jgi:hypothetical protein
MPEKRKWNKNSNPPRDYTYDKAYIKRPEQAKANAARKRARYTLEKEGRVKPFDGKDVDHKNGNPNHNNKSNLQVMSKSKNRSKK